VMADSLVLMSTEKVRVKVIQQRVGFHHESDRSSWPTRLHRHHHRLQRPPGAQAAELPAGAVQMSPSTPSIYELQMNAPGQCLACSIPPSGELYRPRRGDTQHLPKYPEIGTIAGAACKTESSRSDAEIKVIAGDEQLFKGKVVSLKRFKENAREVHQRHGMRHRPQRLQRPQGRRLIEAFSTEKLAANLGALCLRR